MTVLKRSITFYSSESFVLNGKREVTRRSRDVSKPSLPFLGWRRNGTESIFTNFHETERSRFPFKTKDSLYIERFLDRKR